MRTWLSKSLMGPHKLERPIGPESSASDLEVKRGQYAARSSKCAIKLRVSHPPKHIPPLSRRILSKIVAGFCASFCTLFFSYSASGLEVRVAASTDDAEEKPSGSMSLTSSDIELVFDGSDQTVGMRFNAVTIPPGAAITNAYIQFQVDEANSEATSLVIEGEATDNATTFSGSSGNISSRSRTASFVSWSPVPWTTVGLAGPDQQTPNIASIIQEIVNRPGWSSGNSLVVIITGTGHRTAEAFDGVASAAPLLHVDYVVGANTAPTVTITAPANGSTFDQGDPITFTGTATDTGDGDLTASLAWTSSLDGPIGTGGSFSRSDLPVGVHHVMATVTDTGGQTATDAATITVFAATAVLVGAGDIADAAQRDEATAKLLETIPGTVVPLGDNAYPNGTADEFNNYYEPTWGRHKARTRPAAGNHEYDIPGASGYFNYFGAAAGDPAKGYYSYDVGAWHIIVLNSECSQVGGCGSTSPQGQWLQADLAANPRPCTLAIMHKALFASGTDSAAGRDFWSLLYQAGADVVLSGHAHFYERFAPQDPSGVADPARGIREFVVGTGGASLHSFGTTVPNSEVRNNKTHGVLKLTLHPTSYDWEFVPIAGATFTDSGSAVCVQTEPNDVPTANNVTIAGTAQVGQLLTGNYTYTDADGDLEGTSTYRWLRNGASISGATAKTYTLVAADQGALIVFEVMPVAATGASPGVPVQSPPVQPVAPPNTPPQISSGPTATPNPVAEDQSAQLSVTATDADGDPLAYTWTAPPGGGTIVGAGATVTYTPPDVSVQQTFTITVTVSDGRGGTATGSVGVTVQPVGGGGGTQVTFTPVADTYVNTNSPNTNYGSRTTLQVDSSPTKIAYLRFNVTGLSGAVQSARLRLEVVDASVFGGTIHSISNNSWGEKTVTYNTRPAIDGPALAALGAAAVGNIVELDVTAAIPGNGTYSFAIDSNSSNGVYYRSREDVINPPLLIITTN